MIETKVADILSTTKVAFAAGSDHGVQKGMIFVIYELGEEVTDPVTGESLGRLELHKATVAITQVQPKVSVASTIAKEMTREFMVMPFPRTQVVYPQLPLDQPTATAWAEERKLTVKRGDLAHSV